MKIRQIYRLLAIVLVGALSSAIAQNATTALDDHPKSGKYRRSMRVISFGFPVESIFYDNGGKKEELRTGVGSLSGSLPMPKGEFMKLYKEIQLPIEGSDEKKVTYLEVGTIPLIKSSKAIVILKVPEDLTEVQIKGRAFKDSMTLHSKETARVFNLSKKLVAIRAGKETLKVTSGGSGVISWKAVAFNSVAYQIGTIDKETGAWITAERSECVVDPLMRTFVFISGTKIEDKDTVTTFTFTDPIEDEGSDGDTL